MERGSIVTTSFTCAAVVAISIALVIVLFGLGFSTLNHSVMTRAYFDIFTFIYGPVSDLVAVAFDRLPVGGWVVGFGSITTAVTIQNLLMWFIGKGVLEQLRKRTT